MATTFDNTTVPLLSAHRLIRYLCIADPFTTEFMPRFSSWPPPAQMLSHLAEMDLAVARYMADGSISEYTAARARHHLIRDQPVNPTDPILGDLSYSSSPPRSSPPPLSSPPRSSPPLSSPPRSSPPRASPPRASPPHSSPPLSSPPRASPPRASPPRTSPPRASPPRIPLKTHRLRSRVNVTQAEFYDSIRHLNDLSRRRRNPSRH